MTAQELIASLCEASSRTWVLYRDLKFPAKLRLPVYPEGTPLRIVSKSVDFKGRKEWGHEVDPYLSPAGAKRVDFKNILILAPDGEAHYLTVKDRRFKYGPADSREEEAEKEAQLKKAVQSSNLGHLW